MAASSHISGSRGGGYCTPTMDDDDERHRQLVRRYHYNDLSLPTTATQQSSVPDEADTSANNWPANVVWKKRIRHFTWTFFTMTMATGGIANVLNTGSVLCPSESSERTDGTDSSIPVPFRFRGLDVIGTVFFLFNVLLFILNIIIISLRFYFFPKTFRASFLHPTESLFVPASVVSFGTILINISQYGLGETGDWLNTAVCVMFWIDCALAIIASCGIYLLMYGFTGSERAPFVRSLLIQKLLQMVHSDLHYRKDDSCLDFAGLPPSNHWPSRRYSQFSFAARTST